MTVRHLLSCGPSLRARHAGAGALLALLGGAGVASAEGEEAAVVALEPSGGALDSGVVNVVTTRPCPADATNVVVRIAGAGFPDDSNAVGNSELMTLPKSQTGDGLVIPLFGSWEVVAASNGSAQALEGDARMTLLCIDNLGTRVFAEMSGDVRFERQDGTAGRYAQIGGPEIVTGTIPTVTAPGTWEDGAPPPDSGVAEQPAANAVADPAGGAADQVAGDDDTAADGTTPGDDQPQAVAAPVEEVGAAGADGSGGAPPPLTEVASERSRAGGPGTALVVAAGALVAALAAGAALRGRPRRPPGTGPPT